MFLVLSESTQKGTALVISAVPFDIRTSRVLYTLFVSKLLHHVTEYCANNISAVFLIVSRNRDYRILSGTIIEYWPYFPSRR